MCSPQAHPQILFIKLVYAAKAPSQREGEKQFYNIDWISKGCAMVAFPFGKGRDGAV